MRAAREIPFVAGSSVSYGAEAIGRALATGGGLWRLAGLVLVGAVGVADNRAGLGRITVPVLVVWGSEDQVAPLADSDTLLTELPRARREILDGAPHPCYLDRPERWHEVLRTFLTSLAA